LLAIIEICRESNIQKLHTMGVVAIFDKLLAITQEWYKIDA